MIVYNSNDTTRKAHTIYSKGMFPNTAQINTHCACYNTFGAMNWEGNSIDWTASIHYMLWKHNETVE